MRRVIFDTPYNHTVRQFVAHGIHGYDHDFGPFEAMGFVIDGELRAGIVYFEFVPDYNICEMAAYAVDRSWLTKKTLQAIYGYPFKYKELRAVYARHSENNKPVRRIWKSLGATETIIPQIRGDDEAECVAFLHRDVWLASRFAPNLG